MKRFYILGIAMGMSAFLSSLFGCHVSDGDFHSLSVAEFKEYIADTAVVRLDVRTAEEYAEGHITGAVNIDVLQPDFNRRARQFYRKARP